MTTAETIRIEIPIETIDNTDPALSNATKKLDKFGDAADKAGQSVDRTRGYVSKFDEQADKTQKSLAKWAKEKYEIALEAKERISPVLSTLGGSLKSLTSKTWSFTLKALDFATTPIRTVLNLLKNPLLQAGAFFGVSFGLADTVNTQKDFEAAMSQVQAVSGATGDELTQLTKKAERMGATTKFTATESAEAFNYMAMAGWKSEEMMDGIEGILNLAAASNEDLGTTSDIVTDALTAFGLKASDAGMFSDVLAAASSNANTNVSMMGETFKYAASMAGSLGYSIQDVALMTGLMANSGIKASMAGTSLNMIMTRLSTNTGHALDTLQSLGIQFFDSKGNARALADVIEELRDTTANMNDEQKSSVANAIAGTGAQKGLLAILNASETDYNKLANAIDNAAGASERMADTQLDNLSGSITLLQNAVSNDIVEHFGDLHLSLEEIKEAASTIVFDGMEGKFDSYTAQAQKAQSTLTSLKAAVSDLDKENWKMSLGMTVTEADIKEYRSSVSTMVSSTADYLQNKHYEANLALKLIMGDAADTTMLDSTYASFRNQLDDLSDKLSTAIDANIKLNGGVLKLDGDSEILSLQQQIQDITSQVSTAEENAKFDAIKIKYGGAALDAESFTSMQEELKNAVSSMTSQYDDALEVSLTNLRLQLDTGAIDQDEFYRQVQTLTDGYHAQISNLQVRVESFQLDSIAEAYSDALDGILPNLKGTTSEKLQQAMDAALKDNPNVAEWTNSDVVEWFDLNGMDAETQAAVIDLLKSVADSMPASFADSIRGSGLGDAARDATSDELDAISDTPFEKDAYVNVKPHVTVSSTYSASSGLFSSSPAASSSYSYTSPVTGKTVTPYAAGNHSMSIGGHASGGMVNGRELSWVGEEGPEMIIPLVPGRRERAVELYQQAGEILGITAHANGGLVGAGSTSSLTSYNALSSETLNYLTQSVNDAPIDSHALSEDYSSSINNSNTQSSTQQTTVQPNVTVKVEVSPEFNISGGGQSDDEIVAVIRRHMGDVTDELCGKIASKLEEVFANMPLKGVGV